MSLSILDWSIIIGFLLLSLSIGLYFRKEGSKNITSFFLGGRNLPWYVAGLSMVATTFAADTPLAVSELVAQGGIAKNWLWWSFLIGGGLTTFFFSFLWRRANILTELEFISIRYRGKEANLLRGFKAVYLGGFINVLIIGWVNLAMVTLLQVFFNIDEQLALYVTAGLMLLAVIYSTLSGLLGVAITDTVQFILAMVGCIILAVLVLNSDEVGGVTQLKESLPAETFNFFPALGSDSGSSGSGHFFGLTIGAFLAFVGIQWWSSWYPGAEPGGGGYVAQRMMSTRSEEDAVWATLLFQIGHYCIRPWPWIIVGLCAIALYSPEINDQELNNKLNYFSESRQVENLQIAPSVQVDSLIASGVTSKEEFFKLFPEYNSGEAAKMVAYHYEPRFGFVYSMRDFLPNGLRGLLLAAFIAAYLSTISTQVNWGASYLVNDFYLLISKTQSPILISRLASVAIMLLAVIVTPLMTSISAIWEFIIQCGAGLGLALILRWYWWRVTVWAEIAATLTPLILYTILAFLPEGFFSQTFEDNYGSYYLIVGVTTLVWITVAFLTADPNDEKLMEFAKRVRPLGSWPDQCKQFVQSNSQLPILLGCWLSSTGLVIGGLLGIGQLILLEWTQSMIYLSIAILSIFSLRYFLKKTNIFERNSKKA